MNNIKVLCNDRTDVSELIDINKTSASKDWYLLVFLLSFNRMSAMDPMTYQWCLCTFSILLF